MPRISSAFDIVQVSDPATPVAGRQFLYFKSDGLLYSKNAAGVVAQVGAGAAPTNMVTTDTVQTITGFKAFRTTQSGSAVRLSATEVASASALSVSSPRLSFEVQNWTGSTSNSADVNLSADYFGPTAYPYRLALAEGTITGPRIAATRSGALVAFVGGTTSGAPSIGTFEQGDFIVTRNGRVFICTVAGTPGTWLDAGAPGATTVTTDTAQTIAGVKSFSTGTLLMAHPTAGTFHEPYSDGNGPESLERTLLATAPAAPIATRSVEWTADGKALDMRSSDGVITRIGPAAPSVITATLTNNAVATTETVIASFTVPANFLALGNQLDLRMLGQVSATATLIYRIRMGTAGTIADALLATFATSAAGVANAHSSLNATLSMLTATTATAGGQAMLANATLGPATAAFAAATVNLAVLNRITVTLVQSVAQTHTTRVGVLRKLI